MSDDDDEDAATYSHKQRAFLQALLARQVIPFEDGKRIIAAIETSATPDRPTLEGDVTLQDFEEYTSAVNDAISPFDFEIRSSLHQVSKERVYALVNTTSDALTQMATVHSADDIAFVKRVIDAMFDTYNTPRAEVMAITSMQALKLAKAPNDGSRRESGGLTQSSGLTISQAEKVLKSMEEEGWFEHSQKGYYSLSQRALMELRTSLVDMYNEPLDEDDDEEEEPHQKVKFCAACRDIVTVGQRCPNLPCNARLHQHCVRIMFRAQRDLEQCPVCKTEWKDAPPVGEKAAVDLERGGGGRRRAVNGTARGHDAGPATNGHDTDDAESGAELYE